MVKDKKFLVHPEIVPRIQQYSLNNNIVDVEETCEAIKALYPEYAKIKKDIFFQLVDKAVRHLIRQGEPKSSKPYITAQDFTYKPVKRKQDDYQPTGAGQDNNKTLSEIKQNDYTSQIQQDINNRPVKRVRLDDSNKNLNIQDNKTNAKSLAAITQNFRQTVKSIPRKDVNLNNQSFQVEPQPVRFEDFGGIESIIEEIQEQIGYPLKYQQLYGHLGVGPPRGVLLVGPPGCGKTALCNAIAYHYQLPFFKISAPEIVSGMSGESEQKIRDLFEQAQQSAPSIIFMDEIDSIMPKRETAQREMERRIVAQMLTCLDNLNGQALKEQYTNFSNSDQIQKKHEDSQGANLLDVNNATLNKTQNQEENEWRSIYNQKASQQKHVMVLAATNRPESLEPALRRAGRFDRELLLGIPNENQRQHILQQMTKSKRLSGNFDFKAIARQTPGFVGADLEALIKEAATIAIKRIIKQIESKQVKDKFFSFDSIEQVQQALLEQLGHQEQQQQDQSHIKIEDNIMDISIDTPQYEISQDSNIQQQKDLQEILSITMPDFIQAIKKVQPNLKREGFSTAPNINWDDIGALQEVRAELTFWITNPITNPELFSQLGLSRASGVLLFGPPGCGKTLLAKAVANQAGANFISIKGPELLNKYVGESEKAVRQLFSRARQAQPCVLFFDEMDSMAPKRGNDSNQQSERVVNQLLTELDGANDRDGVWVVAASNRPDILDPALLRPGRLDKLLYVPIPGPDERGEILKAIGRKFPIDKTVNLDTIGRLPTFNGYTGADLSGIIREAAVIALKENIKAQENVCSKASDHNIKILLAHILEAQTKIRPSVLNQDQIMYERMKQKLLSQVAS